MSLANELTLIGIFLVILSTAWKGSGRLTHIEDKLETAASDAATAATKAETAADKADKAHEKILEIGHKIDALPCHACPVTVPARWPVR
jgi:hypothetical protein